MAEVDALEVFGGAVAGFIRRFLVFLSAGWVGYGLGILASAFNEWSDFTGVAALGDLQLGPFELAAMTLWPFSQLFLLGTAPILTLVTVALTLGMFLAYVYSDGEGLVWWIGVALSTSLLIVRASIGMTAAPPYGLLAIFWLGLLSAGYYFYRRAHAEGLTPGGGILSGRKGRMNDGYESMAELKARLNEEAAVSNDERPSP